jgi:hypothetical protein
VAILGDQRGHVERGATAQNRADIVRVGHLVEQHQSAAFGFIQHVIQRHIIQRQAFQHQALVRRVARHQPGQVHRLGIFHRQVARQFGVMIVQHFLDRFACAPQLLGRAVRVGQRRFHRVAAPQPHRSGATPARSAPTWLRPARPRNARPFLPPSRRLSWSSSWRGIANTCA